VADKIKEDPFTWSEAVLGMQPAKYCEHIQKSTSWGGAIELAILSQVYNVEIDSVDVQSGRADREH
jgi:ubiquitin thioesterase OTU1